MLIKKNYKLTILLLIFTTIFSFNSLINHQVEAKEETIKQLDIKSTEKLLENKEMKNSDSEKEANLQNNEEQLKAFSNDKSKKKSLVTKEVIVPEAEGMLTAFPNINIVDAKTGESTGKVPGEYANILMYSSKTEYKVVGATSKLSGYSTFDENATEASGGEHYIEATNVGVYQGKKIDVRINAQSMTGKGLLTVYTAKTATSSDFLRIRVQGRDNKIAIRYDFIDHDTGKKIPYKGTWIVKRLNDYKTLRIDTSAEHLKSIFGYSTSAIAYSNVVDDRDKTDFVGTTGVLSLTNLTTQMMYSFNAKNGSTVQEYLPDGIGNRNVYYDSVAIAQMEVPFPSLFGKKTEDYPKVKYEIQQDYPEQAKASFYPTSYNLAVLLDDIVDVNSLKMTVKDLEGNDVTNKFTLTKVTGTKLVNISVASSTLTNSDFVNNSYTIEVESNISLNANLDKYIQEDGYLHIPASISMQTNQNQSPVQTDDALVKSPIIYGMVHTKYVLEDESTEIADSISSKGVVGENFTTEQKEIEGYEFVKTVGEPTGQYEQETQTVLYVYKEKSKEAPKLVFDQASSTDVQYDGQDLNITGHVSDADSDKLTVFYTLDNAEAKEIATFTQNEHKNEKFNYEKLITKDLLSDGRKHIIKVFAVDSDEISSEEASLKLMAFEGVLEFVESPNVISFGTNLAISPKKQTYYVKEKDRDLIVKDTRKNEEYWRMSTTLKSPLTSDSGATIDDAVYYDNKVITLNQSLPIFEHKTINEEPVNISKFWIEKEQGLNLNIPAGKAKPETYSTEMIWSLESVPNNV